MAITIEQQPELFSLTRQDLIYLVTSTEYAQPGFKIFVEVRGGAGTTTLGSMFYDVNPVNAVVVNIKEFVQGNTLGVVVGGVHALSGTNIGGDDGSDEEVEVEFTEYWLVAGVLTENAGSGVTSDFVIVPPGYYDPKYGFSPDPEGTNTDVAFTLNGATKRAMSDRKWNTHKWQWAETFGLSFTTASIYIPVRELDYGVLKFPTQNTYLTNNVVDKIRVTIYDSSGAPHAFTESIAWTGTPTGYAYVYPANLNASTTVGLFKPSDYPSWRFYTVQFLTSANAICAATYVFYNSDLWGQKDCKYDVVRIAFGNSRGGWDYFNFIKKNEESISIERSRYYRVRGNYGSAAASPAFTYGAYEAGLTERPNIVQQYLQITSDWIQEEEFVFLRSLLASNQVHWVQDDGTFIPVVIEATDYVMKRERNGKLKNLELKLRLANNLIP